MFLIGIRLSYLCYRSPAQACMSKCKMAFVFAEPFRERMISLFLIKLLSSLLPVAGSQYAHQKAGCFLD